MIKVKTKEKADEIFETLSGICAMLHSAHVEYGVVNVDCMANAIELGITPWLCLSDDRNIKVKPIDESNIEVSFEESGIKFFTVYDTKLLFKNAGEWARL